MNKTSSKAFRLSATVALIVVGGGLISPARAGWVIVNGSVISPGISVQAATVAVLQGHGNLGGKAEFVGNGVAQATFQWSPGGGPSINPLGTAYAGFTHTMSVNAPEIVATIGNPPDGTSVRACGLVRSYAGSSGPLTDNYYHFTQIKMDGTYKDYGVFPHIPTTSSTQTVPYQSGPTGPVNSSLDVVFKTTLTNTAWAGSGSAADGTAANSSQATAGASQANTISITAN